MTGILAFAWRYWAAILALGFGLGTVRTLWLAPAVGETAAVALELPLMLAASWWLARRLLRRRPLGPCAALAAGAIALALLLASELALAVLLAGGSPRQWLAALGRLPGALGLAGQVAFALLPALLARR